MSKNTNETKPEQQPICSKEAEQAVIGSVLVRSEVLDVVADILDERDFYWEAHGRIFHAMLDLAAANLPVDLVTVTGYLDDRQQLAAVGGPVFLAGLSEQTGFATNAEYYGGLVRDKALLRRLKTSLVKAAVACHQPHDDVASFLDSCESQIFQVMDNRQIQAQPLSELVAPEMARIESLHERRTELLGVPSGFVDLDRLTQGFQKGDLVIIAARPSMGKTSLASNIAFHAAHYHQVPVAFFSMEMSKAQLVQRLIASEGRIDSDRVRSGRMEQEEWSTFNKVGELLMQTPIIIDDQSSLTPLEIRARTRRLKSRHSIGWWWWITCSWPRTPRPKAGNRRSAASPGR
jgi:replicative DNA helicase